MSVSLLAAPGRSDDKLGSRRWLSRVPIVEFDRAIADRWAELFALLTRAGSMIPSNDLQVAATGLHFDFPVLLGPRGDGHYAKVPGLSVTRLTV